MIRIFLNNRGAMCLNAEKLTTGSVGIPMEFLFSSDWEGLSKVAVFRGSGRSVDVLLSGANCTIPPEVLSEPGGTLQVGAYGTDGENIVIPTVYADVGLILLGAELSGVEPTPHTAELVDQILVAAGAAQTAAENAEDLARSVRDDADDGLFNGQDGFSPLVSVASIQGGHRITITDGEGTRSFDVLDGSAYAVTVDNALSAQSENPVENRVIKAALDDKADAASIPTRTSDLQNDSGFLTQHQDISRKADKAVEITVATSGVVSRALDAGKIYHFTGALTALTLTLNTPVLGDLAQYHFDFNSGASAPTLTIPNTVTMPDGWSVEAGRRYEVDILNNYGEAASWANS